MGEGWRVLLPGAEEVEPEPVTPPRHRSAVEELIDRYAAEAAAETDLQRNAGKK